MRKTMSDHIRKILVLRRHNHVGDMLCSLPLYAALKTQWPESRISLLATPTRYPIPLEQLNPFLDEVMYYHKGSVTTVLREQWKLRGRGFDMAIVPSTVALSQTSHITAFLSGARRRVGISSLDGIENPGRRWLNVTREVQWVTEQAHQMERNREIAELAGCTQADVSLSALQLRPGDAAVSKAERWLEKLPRDVPLVGVHPGAGKPQNIWPTDRFIDVLRALHRDTGCAVVITSGALDAQETAGLSAACEQLRIPHRILAQAEIPLLSAVLQALDLYLCNDTGTMHLAAFSGCPTVSLFGPTFAWEWAPVGARHRAVVSHDGDIISIPIEEVQLACREILGAG